MPCVPWLCCSRDSRAFYQSRRRAFSQAFTTLEWGLTAGSGCPTHCECSLPRILCDDCENTLPVRGRVGQAHVAQGGLCVFGVEFWHYMCVPSPPWAHCPGQVCPVSRYHCRGLPHLAMMVGTDFTTAPLKEEGAFESLRIVKRKAVT